jgi:hypothetical protein
MFDDLATDEGLDVDPKLSAVFGRGVCRLSFGGLIDDTL